ncbi:hypothetical protein JCM15765_24460 [Paradesulfitobacterium aromaticivorans]
MNKLIGRVLATEKTPTTMDKFNFWTDANLQLHAFDIVKVEHIDKSFTFGVIENISHITDAQSFLTNFISSDFGDVEIDEPTLRVGMNYAEAKVSFNNNNLYTPVHNNAKVYLASAEEITMALGLDKIQNPLVCGSLKMYEGTKDEVTLPVKLNSKFILGPEGAHLNISGISGLASKTSYAMFLMKAIQDQYLSMTDSDDSVAFVIFNVKGCDLMAIDRENDFVQDTPNAKEETLVEYKNLGLSPEPFKNVKYFIPYYNGNSAKQSTYLPKSDVERYMEDGQLKKYKYVYSSDKESIEMMFSNIDDPAQTMESIISKIIDEDDPDFKGLSTWADFIDKVTENSQKGSGQKGSNDISVLSWRKFKRIVRKAIQDEMFANRVVPEKNECRLADELKPLHLIQNLDRATNNNIEHQSLEFVMYTMLPWFKRWEENINMQLLTPLERRSGYYIEFKIDNLLRGDAQSRATAYATGRQWGWLSVNDIRKLENMPPISNGDIYLTPSNMIEAGTQKAQDDVKAMAEEIYKFITERGEKSA